MRLRWSRPVAGLIRSVTVSFEAGYWWISVLAEDGVVTPQHHRKLSTGLGLDRGITVAVADSAGGLHNRVFVTHGEQRRMLALQRRQSRQERVRRKTNGTNSRRADETRAKLRKVWARIRARRNDFWYRLELALSNQARYTATRIVKVNPAHTSQTCHACGHTASESRASQAVFRCVACGHRAHADVNAARNILTRALALAGREGRKPPENNGRVSHGSKPPAAPRQPVGRSKTAAKIHSL